MLNKIASGRTITWIVVAASEINDAFVPKGTWTCS